MGNTQVSTGNDWFYGSREFQAFFAHSERSTVLKANAPHFTIVAASNKYLRLTHRNREELLGRDFFDIFPGNAVVAAQKESLLQSFYRVMESGKTDTLPLYEYQLFLPDNGEYVTQYWSNINEPILDEAGAVTHIIRTVTNVTDSVLSKTAREEAGVLKTSLQHEQLLNEQLAAANEELRALNEELHDSRERLYTLNNDLEDRVKRRTTALYESQHRLQRILDTMAEGVSIIDTEGNILYVNKTGQEILGITEEQIKSRTFDDSRWQNLRTDGTPLPREEHPMARMMAARRPLYDQEIAVQPPGENRFYISINATPLFDEEGNLTGGIGTFTDSTHRREYTENIQKLNENLTSANEELAAANEEYLVLNKELYQAKQEADTERQRLSQFLMQAPVAICLYTELNLVHTFFNSAYQALLPGRYLNNLPLRQALPELAGSLVEYLLRNIFQTGEALAMNEVMIPLADKTGGKLQERYFSFRFEPRRNGSGDVDGIFAFSFEVTDWVQSRKQLEQAYEELKLSKQAAQLGTFDFDIKENDLIWDDRCRELFGITHNKPVSYETDFAGRLHPDDKDRVITLIQDLFSQPERKGEYDVEYRTLGAEDGRIRWVRAKGKVFFDTDNQPDRFLGMVLDITEQKRDEQRKSDFIAMVSHEMKTPLTSLSGYLQFIQLRTGGEDALTAQMLQKANLQVNRITKLINGFLNVSRLESGKIQIDKQRFDLAELIREAEEDGIASAVSHAVVFHPVQTAVVSADKDKIAQVIQNIISNAIKYSPPNSTVRVALVTTGGKAIVRVQDEGIGIKPEHLPHIFDRYYRVSENNQVVSGFGIGLYLCAEIISRHNGHIWVESEVGTGSTFFFSLPLEED